MARITNNQHSQILYKKLNYKIKLILSDKFLQDTVLALQLTRWVIRMQCSGNVANKRSFNITMGKHK